MRNSVLIRLTAGNTSFSPYAKQRQSNTTPLSLLVHSSALFSTADLKAVENKRSVVCSKVGDGNKKVNVALRPTFGEDIGFEQSAAITKVVYILDVPLPGLVRCCWKYIL